MTNVITATFGNAKATRTAQAYQFDYGQILKFTDIALPSTYEVHFANKEAGGNSVTQLGDSDGVSIPDSLFQSGEYIYAWVYLHTGESDGETVYKTTIPVIKRARPTNETPTPVQHDVITETIAALQAAVESIPADYPASLDLMIDKNEGIFSLASFAEGDEYDATTNPTGWDDECYWNSTGPKNNAHFRTTGIIENVEQIDLYLHHSTPAPSYVMYVTGYDMTDPSNPTYIAGSYVLLQGNADSNVVLLPYADSRRFFRVSFYYKSTSFLESEFYIQYTVEPTEVYDIEKPIPVDKVYGFSEAARLPILDAENRLDTIETESVIGITYLDNAVKDAFDRLQDYVGSDKTAIIGHITDIHGYIDKLAQMSKVNELFEFDAIIHGGDIALGPFDPALTQAEMRGLMLQSKRRMNCTAPWIFTNGNHDGPVYGMNGSDVGQIFNSALSRRGFDVAFGENESYGYIDLKNESIRLVFLNTSDKSESSSGYRISQAQYNFFIDALESVPNGYNVVVTSHVTPDATITHMTGWWQNGDATKWGFYPYVLICNAFNAHKSGSFTSQNVSLSWDFTGKTSRIVCVISGHEHINANHLLRVTNDPGSNVMYIVRQGYGSSTTDSGSQTNVTCPSGYVGIFDRFDKAENSLFDMLCIKADGTAKVIRIGVGGEDRDLSFNWGALE
jgi:hypothetical protein